MDDSGWSYAQADGAKHATLYDRAKVVAPYTLVTYPDGGLRTSVASLARYASTRLAGGALGDARILQQSSVNAKLAPHFAPDALPDSISECENKGSLGWFARPAPWATRHGGDPGITTPFSIHPEDGSGRIFVTNTLIADKERAVRFRAIWMALDEETLAKR